MGRLPERAVAMVSAPAMIAGLAAMAVADTWIVRFGGAAMVVGASVALALTGYVARWLGWGLAVLGGAMVLVAWL